MSHRVNLTLSDDLYRSLVAYARAVGSTPSTVVHDLLVELSPSFDKATSHLTQAETLKKTMIPQLSLFLDCHP